MRTNFPDIKGQEKYWDWWEDTRSTNPWALERAEVILNLIRELQLKNVKIIDLGCGTGWFSVKLADFGKVTAIDLSRRHMEEAKSKYPFINFIHGDLFTYPLNNNTYDLVISQQVIAHVPNQKQYIQIAADLLKPKGWLIISTNNKFVMDRLGEKYDNHKELGHIENWLTSQEMISLLSKEFNISKKISINPRGSKGILRFINSYKLNKIAGLVFKKEQIKLFKEKLGLGYVNIFLAQKKH